MHATRAKPGSSVIPIERIEVSVYTIPTETPESDGTYRWDKTTMVLVEVTAGGVRGLGYTYADKSTAELIKESLTEVVQGKDAMAIPSAYTAMIRSIRNLGRPGISSMAISAVDTALWDLKARLLGLPLVTLLGQVRDGVPIYASGGFTSYSVKQLQAQLGGWASEGNSRVKMKIGRHAVEDLDRVRAAREAIGPDVALFVDANGGYSRKVALAQAETFATFGVTWFEEPVPSSDLDGLHLLRNRAPAGMDIAAGEYGYEPMYFRRMLDAQAVDVLQADGTRCGGITGFMQVAPLCDAHSLRLSAHCAPALHLHPGCAIPQVRNLEYFFDHARIEQMLFDGAVTPVKGELRPDLSRPGLGLELKRADAARYAA